jgi:hypothetical protein
MNILIKMPFKYNKAKEYAFVHESSDGEYLLPVRASGFQYSHVFHRFFKNTY